MIITTANDKGGVGKTTTALMVATALARRGCRVGLLDADPQGSATHWAMLSEDAGAPLPFSTVPVNMRMMSREARRYDHAIIDTPPGNTGMIAAAIDAADVVIVPTGPAPMDIQRVWPTFDAADAAGKPCGVLLTRIEQRTITLRRSLDGLREAGVVVFDTLIPRRQDIVRAFGTVPVELHGYDAVADQLLVMARG